MHVLDAIWWTPATARAGKLGATGGELNSVLASEKDKPGSLSPTGETLPSGTPSRKRSVQERPAPEGESEIQTTWPWLRRTCEDKL